MFLLIINTVASYHLYFVVQEPTTHGVLFRGPVNIKWEERTPAPVGHCGHTAVWLNGLVYLGGANETGFQPSYTINSYDPVNNLWSSPINLPYCYFAMTKLNNRLVIAGGEDKSCKKTNQVLKIDNGQVNSYTKMTTERSRATAAGHQGMLIVTGGWGNKCKRFSATELFDSNNEQWYMCDDLPQPHYWLKSVIVDNVLYLLGGFDKLGISSPAVFTAPLDTLSTHQLKWDIYQETPWYLSAPVSVNSTHLLIVGGYKKKHTTDIHKLNKDSQSWEAIGHIPSAKRCLAAVSTPDNRIIVIGGMDDECDGTNTIWIGLFESQL